MKQPDAQHPSSAAAPAVPERQRMIAEIAYFRAERRGFQGGDPVADWLEAEREVERILVSVTDGADASSEVTGAGGGAVRPDGAQRSATAGSAPAGPTSTDGKSSDGKSSDAKSSDAKSPGRKSAGKAPRPDASAPGTSPKKSTGRAKSGTAT